MNLTVKRDLKSYRQRAKQTKPLSNLSSDLSSKMAAAHMFSPALLPGLASFYEEPIVL